MLTALLLPLLVATGGTPAASQQDDPPVQLWINNDRRFVPGDRAKVHVRTEDDGYLIVLHADPDGYLRVLFPLDPDDDNFVRGGRKFEVRGRGGREAFEPDATGRGTVYAAVSREPFRFGEFVVGDHWDYRALAPNRLPREPEAELTELVRRMAGGSFDYDVLTYDVIERRYASNYSYGPSYYFPRSYDPWCDGFYSYRCGYYGHGSRFSLSVGLFFGSPFRRRIFYDPFFYDPFYYDPFFYRPAYVYPVYVVPRRYYVYDPFYQPFYRHPYRDRFYAYTPYRFRTYDGGRFDGGYRYRFNDGYRDRRYDLTTRSVNTVYLPPTVGERRTMEPPSHRVRNQPGVEVPRRAVTGRSSDEPSRAGETRWRGMETPRRTEEGRSRGDDSPSRRTADERRPTMESRPVEGRRARPAEGRSEDGSSVGEARRRDERAVEARPSREERRERAEASRWNEPEAHRVERPRELRDDRPREERPQIERAPAPRSEPRSYRGDDSPRPRAEPRRDDSGDRSVGRSGGRSDGGSWSSRGGGDRGSGGARSSGGGRSSGGDRGSDGGRGSGGGRRR